MTDERHAEYCPRCNAHMEQSEDPIWTLGELAADLSRENETKLLWYSTCPQGCKQCFGCKEWLAPSEICATCPPCTECGGPLVVVDLGGDDDDDEENLELVCIRCEDAEGPEEQETEPADMH
jgi:hypothetical protein